tara:strand:- start:901 stop:1485 length:585 start_codon:yes stop_codon:yes gene_type:complete
MKNILILKPFGPSIIKIEMSPTLVKILNNYADEEIKKSKEKKEIVLDNEIIRKLNWINYIGTIANNWRESESKKTIKDFSLIKTWISRQFKDQFDPVHFYNSGHISGIGYLKTPKLISNSEEDVNDESGRLSLIHGSLNVFCNSIYKIQPKVGDFYFFPSYLMNINYPFTDNDEEIRSIKFSASIDAEEMKLDK